MGTVSRKLSFTVSAPCFPRAAASLAAKPSVPVTPTRTPESGPKTCCSAVPRDNFPCGKVLCVEILCGEVPCGTIPCGEGPNGQSFDSEKSIGARCKAAVSPITMTAGAFRPARSASSARRFSGARTHFCRSVAPSITTAAGREGGIPAPISRSVSSFRWCIPIRTTRVPERRASAP